MAVTGRVQKVTCWVPLEKAQSIRRVQGPVQRALGLATVHVDVPGRQVGAKFRDRPTDEADRLVQELASRSRAHVNACRWRARWAPRPRAPAPADVRRRPGTAVAPRPRRRRRHHRRWVRDGSPTRPGAIRRAIGTGWRGARACPTTASPPSIRCSSAQEDLPLRNEARRRPRLETRERSAASMCMSSLTTNSRLSSSASDATSSRAPMTSAAMPDRP